MYKIYLEEIRRSRRRGCEFVKNLPEADKLKVLGVGKLRVKVGVRCVNKLCIKSAQKIPQKVIHINSQKNLLYTPRMWKKLLTPVD